MKKKSSAKDHSYKKSFELGLVGSLLVCLFIFTVFRHLSVEVTPVEAAPPPFEALPPPKTEQPKRPLAPPIPTVPVPVPENELPQYETLYQNFIDINQDIPALPEKDEQDTYIFIADQARPVPVGGLAAIEKNLVYPRMARRLGLTGTVVVDVLVGVNGRVVATEIVESAGFDQLDQAAVKAIRSVRWKPATQRGEPVEVWVRIPLVFRLH